MGDYGRRVDVRLFREPCISRKVLNNVLSRRDRKGETLRMASGMARFDGVSLHGIKDRKNVRICVADHNVPCNHPQVRQLRNQTVSRFQGLRLYVSDSLSEGTVQSDCDVVGWI